MAGGRQICFSPECDLAAETLGGYQKLDPALDAVWDALMRNPFGLNIIETDFTHQERFIVTKRVGACPSLIWLFVIREDQNVEITHVEEFEEY
jgi:hypothetical protein